MLAEQLTADGYTLGQWPADAPTKVERTVVYYRLNYSGIHLTQQAARTIAETYFNGQTEALPPRLASAVADDVDVVIVAGADAIPR